VSPQLAEAWATHRRLYDALLADPAPQAVAVASPPGTGKTTHFAEVARALLRRGRWPTVPRADGGRRPARVLYLAPTKEAAEAFVAMTDGVAVLRLGRQADPADPHHCADLPRITRLARARQATGEACRACFGRVQAAAGSDHEPP
jgi:hypothetical protein